MHGQRRISSPTDPGFKQNTEASPWKGQNVKAVVDAGELPSPNAKQSKTGVGGSDRHPYTESKGGASELKLLPTPIDLFEDECVFCHSFRTSEIHGPMVRYLNRRIVSVDEDNSSDAIYVHKKCLEWAPQVWFDGDIVMNLEKEIRRASRLRCRRCGLPGAALGCFYDLCKKSFHVPCAVQIVDCRWDVDERNVLCPEHVSKTLKCDRLGTHAEHNDNSSSLRQRQCSHEDGYFTEFEEESQQFGHFNTTNSFLPKRQCTDKEGNLDDRHREYQQSDEHSTSNASSLPWSTYTVKEVNFDNHGRKSQQTDKLNVSYPSYVPQSQPSEKEGISIASSRDGQQIDQLDTSTTSSPLPPNKHSDDEGISKNRERDDHRTHKVNTSILSPLPQRSRPDKEGISSARKREEIKPDKPDKSSCPSDQLVLLGLSLSVSEKDSLQEFARRTNAALAKEWAKNVTHVIVGKRAGSSWGRSFQVLMAILHGKWVVHSEWISACLTTPPCAEASYEVALGTIEGPKKGRIRAAEGARNLFSGLRFCLSAYMSPGNRDRTRDLIAAAGGRVLEKRELRHSLPSPATPYLVYDVDAPRVPSAATSLQEEIREAREHAAAGAQVIGHHRVLDAVAAYDAEVLNLRKAGRSSSAS